MTDTAISQASDDGIHSGFFYGTLMVPEVFYSVCYNNKTVPDAIAALHTFTPAILHGYSRRRVKYADYPGITADSSYSSKESSSSSSVFGSLVTGLTRANLEKLDFFEGNQYERRKVRVKVLKEVGNVKGEGNVEGEEKEAQVYVFLDETDLEDREWDLEEFRREKLTKWTRAGYVFEDCDPNEPAQVYSADGW